MLGAILIHNDAFNAAAEVIDAGDFFRDAHRRIFDRMVALNERGDAIDFVTLERRAVATRRSRRSGRAGLHRLARGRRAAIRERRVLREDRQRKVHASQPHSFGEQDSRRRVRRGGRAGPAARRAPSARSSRLPRIGFAPGSCRCAIWCRPASRRLRSCSSTKGWSPVCRPDSSISMR